MELDYPTSSSITESDSVIEETTEEDEYDLDSLSHSESDEQTEEKHAINPNRSTPTIKQYDYEMVTVLVNNTGINAFDGKYVYSQIQNENPTYEHIQNEHIIIRRCKSTRKVWYRYKWEFIHKTQAYYCTYSNDEALPSSGWYKTDLGYEPGPNVALFEADKVYWTAEPSRDEKFRPNFYRLLIVSNTGFESMDGQYEQNEDDAKLYTHFKHKNIVIKRVESQCIWQFFKNEDAIFTCHNFGKFPPTSGWQQNNYLSRSTVGDIYVDIFQLNPKEYKAWKGSKTSMNDEIKQCMDNGYSIISIDGVNVSSIVLYDNIIKIAENIIGSNEEEKECCFSAYKNKSTIASLTCKNAPWQQANGSYKLSYDSETDLITYIHAGHTTNADIYFIKETKYGWSLMKCDVCKYMDIEMS